MDRSRSLRGDVWVLLLVLLHAVQAGAILCSFVAMTRQLKPCVIRTYRARSADLKQGELCNDRRGPAAQHSGHNAYVACGTIAVISFGVTATRRNTIIVCFQAHRVQRGANYTYSRERHKLVDSGPFSIIRHPLYFVFLSIPLWTTLTYVSSGFVSSKSKILR